MTIWEVLAIHFYIWSCIGIYSFVRSFREHRLRKKIIESIQEKIHTEESFMNIVKNIREEDENE
jgi:hypothetical protein